jgi:hypothetical protein
MKANLSAVSRQQSVNSLVAVLGSNPSQQQWTKAVDRVLNRHRPMILKMRQERRFAAIKEFAGIVGEAREVAGLRSAPKQTVHQKAVNSLLELTVFTHSLRAAIPDAELSVPLNQVPALFRAAIREQKAAARNPYRDETAILETALALLEHAKQDEFYSALAFTWEAGQVRVRYAPENLTVN